MNVSASWWAGVTCAVLLTGCGAIGDDAGPARWDLRVEPVRTDQEVAILVEEQACAGGVSAAGRIVVDVDELGDSVELDVRVRRRSGDQTCPGNPRTPYLVELDSPIGDRQIVGLRRDLDIGDPMSRPVKISLEPPRSVPAIASERSASLRSWAELGCGGSYLHSDESDVEYASESAAVGAAIDRLGLSPSGWHVLRLPTPWFGGSSWWLQFLDGNPVVQINADRRVLGWRAIGTVCAGLPARWEPDAAFGEIELLEPRVDSARLEVIDLLADIEGLTRQGDRWIFDDTRRCAAWVAIEDAAIVAGATITFTSWVGRWPDGVADVPVEGVMGVARGGRGVRLTSDDDELVVEPLAVDLVWEDVSSLLPCRLDSTVAVRVVDP